MRSGQLVLAVRRLEPNVFESLTFVSGMITTRGEWEYTVVVSRVMSDYT